MRPIEEVKKYIEKSMFDILGVNCTRVESTLEKQVFYVYTGVWFINWEQLQAIQKKMIIQAITIDGHELMITVKS